MKIAIVHDYLNQYGGAERLLEAICELYPDAPIYTSIYSPERVMHRFDGRDVRTSFMQKLPGVIKHHQAYLPFYSFAFESFDLSGYDLVISSSSAWAKGVKTSPDTLHICYCHTPMRFVWQFDEYAKRERMKGPARAALPLFLNYVRLWDVKSAQRPDFYVANSRTVARRITEFWQRDSVVINPPVEVENIPYRGSPRQDFYLWVGRMVPYKRADVAIRAFKELDLPLKVVGTGRDMEALKGLAGPKTEFLGFVPDEGVRELFTQCRAFIQVGAEDFGITPVEAMAGGAPVIAINQYGPAEIVIDGENGLFFDQQTPEALIEAVKRFENDPGRFNSDEIRRYAETFDRKLFCQRFGDYVNQRWEEHQGKNGAKREPLNV
ncbi:MAG: glycosyltransferase family 4 protein [Chloroflexi bacterium]|nr:glycosyltransferase family 4 protein [Chloroflexota bacterium]